MYTLAVLPHERFYRKGDALVHPVKLPLHKVSVSGVDVLFSILLRCLVQSIPFFFFSGHSLFL